MHTNWYARYPDPARAGILLAISHCASALGFSYPSIASAYFPSCLLVAFFLSLLFSLYFLFYFYFLYCFPHFLSMSEYSQVIADLESLKLGFEDENAHPKFIDKDKRRWQKILGSGISERQHSSAQSIQRRAHTLATTVLRDIGPEVLLLLLSSASKAQLAKLHKPEFFRILETWWRQTSHPQRLTTIASEMFPAPDPVTTTAKSEESPGSTEANTPAAFGITIFFLLKNRTDIFLERSIYHAAQIISRPEDRVAWVNSALAHLQLLRRLSCSVDENMNALVALVADMDCMKKLIGTPLYNAVQESRARSQESTTTTKALPLYLSRDASEDYLLEAYISSRHRHTITEQMARMTSVEDWKPILGDDLYTAMKTSKTRLAEEGAGQWLTSAVRVSSPRGEHGDGRVLVHMNFERGRTFWHAGYP